MLGEISYCHQCKFLDDNPTKYIFDDHFYKQYRTVEGREGNLTSYSSVKFPSMGIKIGWPLLMKKSLGSKSLSAKKCSSLSLTMYGSAAAQQARLSQLESGAVYPENNEVITYIDMCGSISYYVRKWVHEVLVKVLTYEIAGKYHLQEKIHIVQVENKAKVIDTMEASFVVTIKEMLL